MAALLALILVATPASAGHVGQLFEHYRVEVPAGYVLKDISPKEKDVRRYALADTRTGSVKCTLVLGHLPKFPKLRWSGKPTESRQSGGSRKEFRAADRIEGLMDFDGLSWKDNPMPPWGWIYYVGDHLSASEVKLVATTMDSISVIKKDLR